MELKLLRFTGGIAGEADETIVEKGEKPLRVNQNYHFVGVFNQMPIALFR